MYLHPATRVQLHPLKREMPESPDKSKQRRTRSQDLVMNSFPGNVQDNGSASGSWKSLSHRETAIRQPSIGTARSLSNRQTTANAQPDSDGSSLSLSRTVPGSLRNVQGAVKTWWQNLDFREASNAEESGVLRNAMDEVQIFCHTSKEGWQALSWQLFCSMVFVFLLLSVSGCALVWLWSQRVENTLRKEAISITQQTGLVLGRELQRVLAPLFTLRGFVSRTPVLLNLSRIAMDFPLQPDNAPTRIVQGIPPETLHIFNDFATELFESLGSESADCLVALQLLPRGVISAIHPLEGQDPALGHDVLNHDRDVRADVLDAVNTGNFSMVGPFRLLQGWDGIVGYLPLFVDESVPGSLDTRAIAYVERTVFPGQHFWGFMTALLDFNKLVRSTGARSVMANHKLRFKMRRNQTTLLGGERGWKVDTFFESDEGALKGGESVQVQVPNNAWTIDVDRVGGFRAEWLVPSCVGVVACALVLSVLSALVLLSQKRQRQLLHRIIPARAVRRLQKGEQVAEAYPMTTIFFSDLVGFTSMSSRKSAMEVVEMLNDLFTDFDKLARYHKVFKVDTIGDAYMVVAGAPDKCGGPEGAARVASFALDALELIGESASGLRMRAGLASGPAVAAVLGTSVPKYSFFGDTVNTASRMESTGEAGRLQVTDATRKLLEESGRPFSAMRREGEVQVKGKGPMQTFWVTRPRRAPTGAGRQPSARTSAPNTLPPTHEGVDGAGTELQAAAAPLAGAVVVASMAGPEPLTLSVTDLLHMYGAPPPLKQTLNSEDELEAGP